MKEPVVKITDFTEGQKAYILRSTGNGYAIVNPSSKVERIGRKYVTVTGEKRFAEAEFLDYGYDAPTHYLISAENYGRPEYLFRSEEDMNAFLSNWNKKRFIINTVSKLSMHSFDDDYDIIDEVYNACRRLEEALNA